MFSLEEFHLDFLQTVISNAESRNLMRDQSFSETVCEDLISVGDLTINYTLAGYIKKGVEVSGYDYDDERKILTILNHQFFQEEQVQTLTKAQIDSKFARLRGFYSKCKEGLYNSLEETSEAYSMAYNIYRYAEKRKFDKVRFMILSDGKATKNLTDIPSEQSGKIHFDYRVIDIEYLYNIYSSGARNSSFEVSVDLPCLKVNANSPYYQSYLCVIGGDQLVQIYHYHGQKLFEQNVRTFLQFRGDVNKGLKHTIEYHPEMFFAYNNGITATASSIEFSPNGHMNHIKNFQIVNGGQTVSAIYSASRTLKLPVSKVSVQMKLSVVVNENVQDDFISKAAEYANTQNKINNSDFFSNNPFHKEMKEFSATIFVPAMRGSQRRTHWFYERVRGEYLNSQAYLSSDDKKKFRLENPKEQVADKTLLSKTENAWQQKPHIVCKGAQYSFREFSSHVSEMLGKEGLSLTESYFKDAVSRIILFRNVEKIISHAPWYDGGYRAQTAAYTVSCLSALVQRSGLYLNFDIIWENQALPPSLIALLQVIAEKVYSRITSPSQGYANISQYAKKAGCWERIRELDLNLERLEAGVLISREEKKYTAREPDQDIDIQVFISSIEAKRWMLVLDHYNENESAGRMSPIQLNTLSRMALGQITQLSEKQSRILYDIYLAAVREGAVLE
jgi:hypothetical protein